MTDLSLLIEDPIDPLSSAATAVNPQQPQLQQQPQQTPQGPTTGYPVLDEIFLRWKDQEEGRFMRSFQTATERNPDIAADINKLSAALGVPPEVVANDVTWARRLVAKQEAIRMTNAESDSTLRRQMNDPKFAAIAWDDLGNFSAWDRITGNWSAGKLEVERGRLGTKMMAGRAQPYDIERLSQVDAELEALPSGDSWIGGPFRMFGKMAQTLPTAISYGSAAALATAIAGNAGPQAFAPEEVLTVPTAFWFGFSTGLGVETFQIEGGTAYLDYKAAGFSEGVAINAARTVGAINALLEVGGVAAMFTPIKGFVKDRMRKQVAERMFRMTPAQATIRALKDGSAAMGGEIITEMAQEASLMIGEEVARQATESITSRLQGGFTGEFDAPGGGKVKIDGRGQITASAKVFERVMGETVPDGLDVVLTGEGRRKFLARYDEAMPLVSAIQQGEFIDRLIDTAWFTLKGVWLTGVAGPAVRVIGDRHRIRSATTSQKVFEAAEKNTLEAKVQARDADVYTQYLANSMKGERAETLYITKAKLREKMDAVNVSDEQMEREFPKIAEQLREPSEINEDIEIPLSEWNGYKMFETDLGQAVKEDLRIGDKDAMSFEESKNAAPEIDERVEAIRTKTLADEESRKVFNEEGAAIEKRVFNELSAANTSTTGTQRRVQAAIFRRMVETIALRTGKTPAVAERLYGVNRIVGGGEGTRTAETLNQFVATEGAANEEALAMLLRPAGEVPQIGNETGAVAPEGVSKLTSPEGSIRYVMSRGGAPVGALQIMVPPQGAPRIANAFTSPDARRSGVARELFAAAQKDHPGLQHSDSLTDDGAAFANAVSPTAEPLHQRKGDKPIPTPKTKLTKAQKTKLAELKRDVPGLAPLLKDLQTDEQLVLLAGRAERAPAMVELLKQMPSAKEMAAVAESGRAKRGWYARSAAALRTVFGEDAPRFAALLAALSPQTSVEANLINTLIMWKNWVALGRPTTEAAVLDILGASVQGKGTEQSVLEAWRNNSYRALLAEDPATITLSGPKVHSFMLNLLGESNEVTNDAWMANYALVDQTMFGADSSIHLPGKGAGYLAATLAARKAARKLGWTPAEVQETVWSWTKALYEKAVKLKRTAVDVLTSGDLSHQDINSVPDFDILLRQPEYARVLEAAGYSEQLGELHAVPEALPADNVFSGDTASLLKAAKRLDALAVERAFAKSRAEVLINLSSSTASIPGLKALTDQAAAGDASAATLLREIAIDSLTYLTLGAKSAKVTYTPSTGLYAGDIEPSVGLHISFQEADRERVLRALKQFAQNFNQYQFHVRGDAVGRVGKTFPDGSYNTISSVFPLNAPMTRAEVEKVIADSGLAGMTVTDDQLEVYYVGDPTNAEARTQFRDAVKRADTSLGAASLGHSSRSARLWVYGDGAGATPYGSIDGVIRPAKTDQAVATAQRVATRLAKREVKGADQAKRITEDQATLQSRISDAYDALQDNNLSDPNVRRAYGELATEVKEQFDALPIKVELWAKKGEPYGGERMSEKMRKDVLTNNRLFIFATVPAQFGPKGGVYDNHPMLADSGRTDANGKPMLVNDLLRAVHDYFAHTITPVGFGPKGEEAAWRNHMQMTRSPWARWALTSETRGQNSWVNFNEEAKAKAKLSDRVFAEQKVDLLPLEMVATGDAEVDANLAELPGSEGLLFQDKEQSRGEFDPKKFITTLFNSADASTFFHESAHYFLEMLLNVARSGDAPVDVLEDLTTLAKWGGMLDWQDVATASLDQRRKLHEQFAYRFETYLHSGKAESADRGLLNLFRQIRRWLTQVYKHVARQPEVLFKQEFGEELPQISDEVRAVMDRLLDTQEAIDYARKVRSVSALFEIAEDATVLQALSPEQRAVLRELLIDADFEAEEKLGAVMLRQLRYLKNFRGKFLQEVQSKTRAARKRIHDEELDATYRKPVHRLQHFLNTGEFKNAAGDVEPTADFPRRIHEVDGGGLQAKWVSSKGGSPDVLARAFGYQSGADLLEDLRWSPSLADVVDTRTDRRMAIEHQDLVDETTVEERLIEAMSGPVIQKLIAEQLRMFDKGLPDSRIQRAAAREVARRVIGDRVVGELRPLTYSLAAGRAHRAAAEARRKGDVAAYRAELRRALYQTALAEEASKVRDEMRKGQLRQQKRYQRTDKKLASQKRLTPVVHAGRLIMSRFGLTTPSPESIDNPQYDPFAPLTEDDALRNELQQIVDAETTDAKLFSTLTVDELRDVFDTGDSLWFRSKREREILIDGERVELEDALAQMLTTVNARGVRDREISGSLSKGEKRGRWLRRQLAQFKRMEFALKALDNGTPGGIFTKALWRRAKDAANKMRLDEARYLRRVQTLVDTLDLTGGSIKAKGLVLTDSGTKDHIFGNGEVSGKAELIGALLHMGNLSNRFKLVKGYNWGAYDPKTKEVDTSRWLQFVQDKIDEGVLTLDDFKFVQAIWDINEELKPVAQRAHYEVAGYTFKEIKAQPFAFNFKQGAVLFKGGYVPAATDRDQVIDARLNGLDDLLNFQKKLPMVPKGLTKNRVALYARELDLNPLRVGEHIHSVLLFSHMAPAMKDIRRITEHHAFKTMIDKIDPVFREEVLRPWLESLASQRTTLASKDTWGWLNSFRSRAGQAVMFFNVKNTLQNLSGIPVAMTVVKPRMLMHALGDVLRDREGAMQRVKDQSEYMKDRFENADVYEIRDRFEALVTDRGAVGNTQEWFRKNAYWLQRLTQEPIDTAVWMAAYDQAIIEQGASVLGEKSHNEAVQRADAAVRQTQTSNNPEDLSTAEKGSAWMKVFLQFRGWFISYGNHIATEAGIRSRSDNKAASLGSLYLIGVFSALVSAELIDALADGDEIDDDEDGAVWDDWTVRALRAHLSAITGAIPLWGDAGMLAFSTLFDPKSFSARMPEPPTIGALRQGLEALRSGKLDEGRKARSVLTFLSLMSGVPINRLLGPAVAGYELASGQANTEGQFGPVVEIPRALLTGKTQRER